MARTTLPLFPTDDGWPYPDTVNAWDDFDDHEPDLDDLELRADRHAFDALTAEERRRGVTALRSRRHEPHRREASRPRARLHPRRGPRPPRLRHRQAAHPPRAPDRISRPLYGARRCTATTSFTERIARAVFAYTEARLRDEPVPLDHGVAASTLDDARAEPDPAPGQRPRSRAAALPATCCRSRSSPATVPRFLAFIPAAPTKASLLFDMVVSASSLSGISWLEAAGAVHAENQALRFLADLAGLPPSAGGCFVQGGSAANLSALVVARDTAPPTRRAERPRRCGSR